MINETRLQEVRIFFLNDKMIFNINLYNSKKRNDPKKFQLLNS